MNVMPHPHVPKANLAADVAPTSYPKQRDSSHTLSSVKGQSSQFPQAGVEEDKALILYIELPLKCHLSGTTCHPENQVNRKSHQAGKKRKPCKEKAKQLPTRQKL